MTHQDHEKNRTAWNEMVEIHFRHPDYKVKEFLQGASTLKSIELTELGEVKGKSLLHLMCQFGLDTLSWARLGAQVTGVDISDKSIAYAKMLAEQTGLEADFIRADILDLKGRIDNKFDIVYQSYGTLCWLSDLDKWAEVVAYYLRPGGVLHLIDFHPIAVPWEEKDVSYFKKGPYRYTNNVDYCDKDYIIKNELVEWQHKLSDIINAVIDAGLTVIHLNEFDKSCSPKERDWYEKDGYYYPPSGPPRYPLMFSLKAQKRNK
ncbi:MAG: class I SAM-dependent methyltransferase [FCB group bacterium]|nr:class I SAM-dependent methyltransferase [FCB group bacterium]